MKVLMLSSDPTIAEANSESRSRMIEYGEVLGELEIIVLSRVRKPGWRISDKVILRVASGKFARFWRGFAMAKLALNNNKFDVITAQDIEHAMIAWILSRIYKIPFQMQIHTDIFGSQFVRNSVFNKLRALLAKFLLLRADCIRVVSERIAKSINWRLSRQLMAKPPVTILHVFVDVEKIKNAQIKTDLHAKYGKDKFIILMASRITKEKHISLAIAALSDANIRIHTNDANKTLSLLIVGDGPELETLKLKVKNLKLEDRVVFEPHTNDLISYYKTCDLFLLTSNYEGYGRTLVEAAAAGAQIISSDVGIAQDILEPDCVFKVGDEADLAKKLALGFGGGLSHPRVLPRQTKDDYLKLYKDSFSLCLKEKNQ